LSTPSSAPQNINLKDRSILCDIPSTDDARQNQIKNILILYDRNLKTDNFLNNLF